MPAFLLFLASLVFGVNAYRRDWIMYPKFNVLAWGYALCVVSFILFGLAALVLWRESSAAYDRRRQTKNLIVQMQVQPGYDSQLGFARYM